MKTVVLILVTLAAVSFTAAPRNPQRIVGGSVTTINQYPYAAALLYSWDLVNYRQDCGGTILNSRSILSAAHCFWGESTVQWRIRVGSTYASSGGTVHMTQQFIMHTQYNPSTNNNDIAIVRSGTSIIFNNVVQPGTIAGTNYNLGDNQVVWAIGWGLTTHGGQSSEQLRHVQIWTVNQNVCAQRYWPFVINDNMLCSGWLDVGGRDQCTGDSGGPLLHNNVVVGISSFGGVCGHPYTPGVNARLSRYTTWIQANA